MRPSYKLTEEIARWAFEIRCREAEGWIIAFTNPTAGPWKTIRCRSAAGEEGEVYRFASEETRPDLVLVNDRLRVVLILEAKDSLPKLIAGGQAAKSVEVVAALAQALSALGHNPYWGGRSKYTVLTGVLWGCLRETHPAEAAAVLDDYHNKMAPYPHLESRALLGVESYKDGNSVMHCSLRWKSYDGGGLEPLMDGVAHSLGMAAQEV